MNNPTTLNTKWGNARIHSGGYFRITSGKECNNGKYLHRLIATEYFGDWINDEEEFFDIHHLDGDKTNNCVLNLLPIPREEHSRLHNTGKELSTETRRKIGEFHKGKIVSKETRKKLHEANIGKQLSETTKQKISKTVNSTGYYRVCTHNRPKSKQGFVYEYWYYDENKKHKAISSVNLQKLGEKVKSQGLPWFELSKCEVEE